MLAAPPRCELVCLSISIYIYFSIVNSFNTVIKKNDTSVPTGKAVTLPENAHAITCTRVRSCV